MPWVCLTSPVFQPCNFTFVIFVKVLWLGKENCDVTWEPAENVPMRVISEFEKGAHPTVKESITVSGMGQRMHTLTIDECHSASTSQPRLVVKDSGG